jgi:hypothetical protein
VDEQRRKELLGASSLGRGILKEEERARQAQQTPAPIPPERAQWLEKSALGRDVLRHERQGNR